MSDDDVIVYDGTGLFVTLLSVVCGVLGAVGIAIAGLLGGAPHPPV